MAENFWDPLGGLAEVAQGLLPPPWGQVDFSTGTLCLPPASQRPLCSSCLIRWSPGVTGRVTSGQEPASHPQGQPREAQWEETPALPPGAGMLLP